MLPVDLVKLRTLMEYTSGSPDMKIGVIDGPVVVEHPDLAEGRVRQIPGSNGAACAQARSLACRHGTFVTGILAAKRTSAAPAICPGCTILVRPILAEMHSGRERVPSGTPTDLAAALGDCVDAGARVVNLSLALAGTVTSGGQALTEALNYAARRGVLVVAAAGHATLGSSLITGHAWVIPVVGCDIAGHPLRGSTLGDSIGRQGLRAPGDRVTSLGTEGQSLTLGGTSVAAPFVTGAIALLWSTFPAATASQIKMAITSPSPSRRASVVPPLLDAAAAHQQLLNTTVRQWTT